MSALKWPKPSVRVWKLSGVPPGPTSKLIRTELKGLKLTPSTLIVYFGVAGDADGWSVCTPEERSRKGAGGRTSTGLITSEVAAAAVAGWKQDGESVIAAGDAIAVTGGPLSQVTSGRLLRWISLASRKVAWTTSVPGLPLLVYLNPALPVLSVVAVRGLRSVSGPYSTEKVTLTF